MIAMRFLILACLVLSTAAEAGAQGPAAALPVPTGPLTLARAVELGRIRGVQTALARSAEHIAESRVGQRRADLLPTIGAGLSYVRQTLNLEEFGLAGFSGVTDPFDVFRVQLRATQSLIDPAAWARLRAAKDSVVAAGLDVQTAGALSGAAAGVAWLRVFSAEETVRAREADSTVASDLLEQARRSLDAGVSAAIDLTRSRVNFGSVRSQLSVARNARDRARLDLSRALAIPPSQPIAIAADSTLEPFPLADHADSAVAWALAHRPELAAERQRLDVLDRARRAIRAEYLPSLSASGFVQTSGTQVDALSRTWQVQLGVNVPILDGFRRQYRSQEQGFRIEAQEIRLHDLTMQIEGEARAAVLDLASARDQVAIALDREQLATEELRQAGERFTAGVAGSLETSNAQLNLTAARDALIQARVAYGIARVGAERALGMIRSADR
jgi:outer membrane protein TolC